MPRSGKAVSPDIDDVGVHAFRELTLAIEVLRQAVANRLGVGVTDTVALSYLAEGPSSPRELAAAMRLAPSSITAVVDRLAAAGAVVRTPVESDRRQVTVTITPLGRRWLRWTSGQVREILASADLQDRDRFVEGLGALTTSLRRQVGEIDTGTDSVRAGDATPELAGDVDLLPRQRHE